MLTQANQKDSLGGSDPRKQTDQGKSLPSSKCWRLSPWNGKWEEMACMKIPRTNFASCHFRGKIYAFGGKNSGGEVLSSCERFDPSIKPKGAWNSVMPMPSPCMSMTVAKYGDKLCVIGGVSSARNGVKRPILTSVLIYDPKSNTWSEGTSLDHGRCYSAAASHYNRLYLTGGAGKESDNDRTKSLQDVLCYEDGEWERVGLLKRPRHGHCMVKIGMRNCVNASEGPLMKPFPNRPLFSHLGRRELGHNGAFGFCRAVQYANKSLILTRGQHPSQTDRNEWSSDLSTSFIFKPNK